MSTTLSRAARSALFALAALVTASTATRAQGPATVPTPTPAILDFEPLSTSAGGCGDNTFTAYGGLAWSGWGAANKGECGAAEIGGPRNGWWYGATSGHNTGYIQLPTFPIDPFQTLVAEITTADGFDLLDAWFTALWTTGLAVQVDAYRGTTLAGSLSFSVDYTAPTHTHLNFINITSARFTTSGGTPHFDLGGIGNGLVMDDANVAIYPHVAVPEPASLCLTAIGLAALGAVARRRSRAS